MALSLAEESALISAVKHDKRIHIMVRPEKYMKDGLRVLVTRDGLRVYLHRRLFALMVGPLAPEDYLLRACSERGCQNPFHYVRSDKPYRSKRLCRNGHPYPMVQGRDAEGYRYCLQCRAERNARRRRGGKPNWMLQKERLFCRWGHPYSPENTYLTETKSGGTRRHCRACARARRLGHHPTTIVVD